MKTNTLVATKIRIVYAAMFAMAALLLIFCLRWQVVEASKFTQYAANRVQNSVIPALRGTIYASDGSTLAYSEPRYHLYIYEPELLFAESNGLQTREEFISKIAEIIDTTPEKLTENINARVAEGIYWIKIANSITLEAGDRINRLVRGSNGSRMTGYYLSYTAERIYPEAKIASQVLGLTSATEEEGLVKTLGLGGVEGEWDGYLEPLVGFVSGELDAIGNAIGLATERTIEAKRGSSIYTSIDKRVQTAVENVLKWGVNNYQAISGSVIVMEPTTGRILAMANYPTFNPNLREETDANAYGNKAVSEPYEIGSIGKAFTLSAALDNGDVKPGEVILEDGHKGCESIHKDLQPVCTADKKPQGPMSIAEAFRISDNLYFYHLAADKMEDSDFYDYLSKFGVGKPTGVDLAGESFGYLKPAETWNIADTAAHSFGHSYQVTALQALTGVSALANNGVRMQPQVVTKIVEADGTEKPYEPIALERVVSKETVSQMDQMMHEVYLSNITWLESHRQYSDLPNYRIAMKSGTALIPYRDRLGYSNEINASYVGYDASPDRKFAMIVRLEAPQIGDLSYYNARVLWLESFVAIKDIMGVRRKADF